MSNEIAKAWNLLKWYLDNYPDIGVIDDLEEYQEAIALIENELQGG